MKAYDIRVFVVLITLIANIGWCKPGASSAADSQSQKNKSAVTEKTSSRKNTKFDKNSVFRLLEQKVNLSDLRSDMSFGQAVEILRNSTKPQAKIVVLWKQLEQINVSRSSRIDMDGFSDVRLRTGLKFLLISVADGQNQLDYWTIDGVIVIGPKESRPKVQTTRLYNVSDLTSRPAQYYLYGTGFNRQTGGQTGNGAYGRQRTRNFGRNRAGRTGRGYTNSGTRTMNLRTGASLSAGPWAAGTGYTATGTNGIETQIRQQQISGVIKNTVEPGSWNQ